ncbi:MULTISPECIES: branched-chain amino acid ABC transporter permease [Thioclava]|uniref:branched-chain amino acid ABC transporter permease n=1 Tax=Thioclava TaxID=285107 RepID=UPI000B53F96E|nr:MULTISPECIES: branched-chain amino acid ABC transporter permease [Thioclava]OWY09202.1 branched-chain amino acid ABC transporter permease [Thioclava sp. F42-5]OWY18557.1 branched-chain amino acid ABC transporter permease [Thioclava sp. JM3]PWE50561.1 branched-chain amino acid ABC transporter permease [Thioclava sp. NG1]WGT50020.1 branched-chain amino acid ABC transporter permease [Thioclava nitratireducens]
MSSNRQAGETSRLRAPLFFAIMAALILLEGFTSGWNSALGILNMGLLSAIMALGVNMQWGYAGLFNAGAMGFLALGGLAPVLISMPPTPGAFSGGGPGIMAAFFVAIVAVLAAVWIWRNLRGKTRGLAVTAVLIVGFFTYRWLFDPAVEVIEAINPSAQGNLGGLGLPTLISWPVGAVLAAGAAWLVGKTALGLRSDYLAIATLGIAEIIVAILKNEQWLDRGVLNVNGIPRPWPVPYEIDLQNSPDFVAQMQSWGLDPQLGSTIVVKLAFLVLFVIVILALIWLTEMSLKSPWGRMMRAIRDNEISAAAMGKNVTRRHLQIFVLGSAVIGLAGAMMISLDGQMTPTSYNPLRYTFLILVMVIVGGSGNNWGSILGGVLIWYVWVKAGDWGPDIMGALAAPFPDGGFKDHLIQSAPHMRMLVMGIILLMVLRFSPRGLLPEK